MSIQQIQMLRLPVYEVSDGKATTGESVDKGILKKIHSYEKYLRSLLLFKRGKMSFYILGILPAE